MLQTSNPIIQLSELDLLLMLSTTVLQHLDAIELLSILPVFIHKRKNYCFKNIFFKYIITVKYTFEFVSVKLMIGSFFLKSQIVQRCENVEARICCTARKNKN